MKRIISIFIIVAITLLALTSCGALGAGNETAYEKLTRLTSDTEYKKTEVTVKTEIADGVALTSVMTYTAEDNSTRLDYSIQQLAEFEFVDGKYVVPADMIKTYEGMVRISDGAVVGMNGPSDTPIDFSSCTSCPKFSFKEAFFKAPEITDTTFKAAVIAPVGFLGENIPCSNMYVSVTFADDAVSTLILTYTTSEGSSVTATYKYEK